MLEGDAREEIDHAVAECLLDREGLSCSVPIVLRHTTIRDDGSEHERTAVFVDDDDGWWTEYAREHGWRRFTGVRVHELEEDELAEP